MRLKIKYKFTFQVCILFVLGALSSLSFGTNLIFLPLMVTGLNVLFYYVSKQTCNVSRSFYLGFSFSFGQLLFGLYWIAIAFETGNSGGLYVGLIAVFVLCFFLSSFMALFICGAKYLSLVWNLNLVGFAILFSVLLCFSEYFRGNFLGGFPWNTIGYIWSGSHILLQPVAFIGIYGLGLVSTLGILSLSVFKTKIFHGFYLLLPLLVLMFVSYLNHKMTIITTKEIPIRLVQPNIKQEEKWNKTLVQEHYKKLVNISLSAQTNFLPQYIIWPESAIEYDLEMLYKKDLNIFKWLGGKQTLITGSTRKEYKNNILSKIYNSIFLINNEGEIIDYYDKVKLVPFGEYIPFSKFLRIEKITSGIKEFSSGTKSNIFDTNDNMLKIGLLVCYEIIFPGEVIKGNRPNLLINLTNDAWYRDSIGPVQHLSSARVRAIEEGITVLRVANTGISAVISPTGRYVKKLPLGVEGVIDLTIIEELKPTIFSIYGNFIYIIFSLFMLLISRFVFINK